MEDRGPAGSIPFDRIAGEYDRTRMLPEPIMRKVLALLEGELDGRGRCLEIGVGTGRLALPLHEMGIEMAGVDLSRSMLTRLRAKAGGTWPFPVAQGDATALPFGDRSMGAGLAAHVLHLIPGWQEALSELARVVRPGGVVLADVGNWEGRGARAVLRDRFCREAGIDRPFPGTQDPAKVSAHMVLLGARLRALRPIYHTSVGTLEERIATMEQGVHSFTWQLDEGERRAAAARTRTWAERRFGALDRPRRARRRIVWYAYDLPGSPSTGRPT